MWASQELKGRAARCGSTGRPTRRAVVAIDAGAEHLLHAGLFVEGDLYRHALDDLHPVPARVLGGQHGVRHARKSRRRAALPPLDGVGPEDLTIRRLITAQVAFSRCSRPEQLRGLLERSGFTDFDAPLASTSELRLAEV